MSKLLAIVGPTSTGKSTSIQSLNPTETYIISVAGKELPFKGSNKVYNEENKNDLRDKDILSQTSCLVIAGMFEHSSSNHPGSYNFPMKNRSHSGLETPYHFFSHRRIDNHDHPG